MKESFWGVMILVFGVVSILIVFFFQSMTNTDEHNYTLLKEATEGAMVDAIDLAYYRRYGKVRIDQEKFVENFVRRFAQSAQLSRTYEIKIYDVNEEPPKVSLSVASKEGTNVTGEILEFDIVNKLDAILETPRDCKIDSIVEPDPGYEIIMPEGSQGSSSACSWVYNNTFEAPYDATLTIPNNTKITCTCKTSTDCTCQVYLCK